MTQKETLAAIRAFGMVASYDPHAAEYRVTYSFGPLPGGRGQQAHMRERQEACAYYTGDKGDALDTARTMAEHWAGLTPGQREAVYRGTYGGA